MNNDEFRKQIQEYVNETYDQFCKYQDIAMSILTEFNRIAKSFNIKYYLAYGSLLGAVRDQGQIPWDYDIDILIEVDDRNNLLEILDNNLSSEFYYDYYNVNSTYPVYCIRVCRKGYSMMALHVDIFFLVGTPNDEKKRSKFIHYAQWCMKCRLNKYLDYYLEDTEKGSAVMQILKKVKRTLCSFIPLSLLNFLELKYLYKYNLKDSKLWFAYGLSDKVYPHEIFESTVDLKIGSLSFTVPIQYELFLKITYGESWHHYLSIKSRFDEFYRMKEIVDKRLGVYGI